MVILASGPSLQLAALDRVKTAQAEGRCKVVAINDTRRAAPWAGVLYACDCKWWHMAAGATDFAGERWTLTARHNWGHVERFGLQSFDGIDRPGLSRKVGTIHTGGNSGYQAIGAAVQAGARRVVLLGYDMRLGDDGRRHHHDTEPHPGAFPAFRSWIRNFATMRADLDALGVDVANCTPGSAIPESTFRRADLESVI